MLILRYFRSFRKAETAFLRDPPSWALGTTEVWFDAVIEGRPDLLRLGGTDPPLAHSLVNGIHDALYG